jgi:hypothetical protein
MDTVWSEQSITSYIHLSWPVLGHGILSSLQSSGLFQAWDIAILGNHSVKTTSLQISRRIVLLCPIEKRNTTRNGACAGLISNLSQLSSTNPDPTIYPY